MFLRKKLNKSGAFSVQIIDKSNGYKVVQTLGSSHDLDVIERLMQKGKTIIHGNKNNQLKLFPLLTEEEKTIKNFVEDLKNSQIRTIGPELIFGKLFDRIGFNVIPEKLFRHIVIARLAYPTSKAKTVDYLYRYRGIHTDISAVYRFLDKLSNGYKQMVEKTAFEYTKHTLKNNISIVFYDMTTLYFESEDEDDLRKIGFSKDGKFQKPQIMLGLLVGKNGYPIGYDIFEGNKFEGHTLMPVLTNIQKKYGLKQPTVVADAGLLSKENLKNLSRQKYKFIIGARIKNETDKIKIKIIRRSKGLKDGYSFSFKKPDGVRLIVTYSDKRRKKDMYNRLKGIKKLRLRVKTGKLTKESVNNRGYNKFLIFENDVRVAIDENKIHEDEKWDGLKGYLTNGALSAKTIVENYRHLWQIEKAFRISKTDLKIRPIYHRREKRIEAHICISFVAYTIYKELERLLYANKVGFSPKRAAELTHNMYELEYHLADSAESKRIILKMDKEQSILFETIQNS